MKQLTSKKTIQKITIVMVFLILFNFIMPNYSRAAVTIEDIGEALVTGINWLILKIGDGVIFVLQKIFIGTDAFDGRQTGLIPTIALSPGKIFSGAIYALDINFLSPANGTSEIAGIEISDSSTDVDYAGIFDSIIEDLESRSFDGNIYEITKNGIYGLMDDVIGTRSSLEFLKFINENTSAKFNPDGAVNPEDVGGDEISWLILTYSGLNLSSMNSDQTDELSQRVENVMVEIGLRELAMRYGTNEDKNESIFTEASKASNSPANMLHGVIATWYKIMRNIALIFMLSILVYVGIRIMLASTAADNTKYKKMLTDWVVAICILFVLHYIMSFTINITQFITEAFSGTMEPTTQDEIMNEIRLTAERNIASDWNIAYSLLYIVLIFYTVYFIFYYVKRVVYIAFLTMIAPMVALTYPIDKMGDSKSQAFDMWLQEYILNVIVQPVHLLIYTVMVTSSLSLALVNPIYAIVVIGAMIPAEKFIKEMFGLNSKKGPNSGFAAAALTMGALNKLAHRPPPKFGHHPGGNEKGESKSSEEKTKKPRMDGEKTAELSKSITGGVNEDNSNVKTTNPTTSTEDRQDIDNGDFPDSRSSNVDSGMDEIKPPSEDDIDKQLSGGRQYNGSGMDEIKPPSEDDIDKQLSGEREYNSSRMNGADSSSTNNQEQSPKKDNLIIGPNIPSKAKKEKSNKKKIKGPKKNSVVGAALKATAGHYVRKAVNGKNIRKLARTATRGALGVVATGTAATLGLAAGIATGDPSKAIQYMAAGAVAGNAIGRNVGDGIANFAGGTLDLGMGIRDTYREQRDEILKYNKEAQEAQMKKENKKYAKSAEAKEAIRNRYGNLYGDDLKQKQAVIERYRNAGVEDLDTIFNAYNLEEGKDFQGNDIGVQLSQDHAMYIAQMASKMDDSAASRKSVENAMQMQFAQNYEESGMDRTKAIEQAKTDRKREMQYIDMAKGKTRGEASIAAKQAEINKAYEDSKEEKAARMQAQFNAEAQRSNK